MIRKEVSHRYRIASGLKMLGQAGDGNGMCPPIRQIIIPREVSTERLLGKSPAPLHREQGCLR